MVVHKLSGGDYLFLAFLARGPASAYDVKKEMASSVNFFWSAQHSQVYQQAARLQRDGYVEQRGAPTGRNRRTLALTETGAAAFQDWLRQPAAPYRIYDESLAKLYFARLADDPSTDSSVELLLDQQQQHGDLLADFERMLVALEGVDYRDEHPYQLYTLRLGIEVEQTYLRWITSTLDDLHRREHP